MSASTSIEWTDRTWNPVRGCSVISQGCANCYAMKQAHRFSGPGKPYEGLTKQTKAGPQWTGKIRVVEDALLEPLSWRKPTRVFVNSMSDLFHEGVPDEFIDRVFAVMALAPRHTFQILTKRAERMRDYMVRMDRDLRLPTTTFPRWRSAAEDILNIRRDVTTQVDPSWPLPNVWMGVSVEDQQRADERIPLLLQTPAAAVRFISAEPLLGRIDLGRWVGGNSKEHGSVRLSGGSDGRVGNRSRRKDLESRVTSREQVDGPDGHAAMRATSGRTREGLSERSGDGRPEARHSIGSPAGLAPLQGPDPRWPDGQSRERREVGQQARQPEFGDALRTDAARDADARLRPDSEPTQRLSWVIVGGESGPGARRCSVSWVRSIVRQCQEAEIPVFVKQLGAIVIDRNDAGFMGDEPDHWPAEIDWEDRVEHDLDGSRDGYQGAPVRIHLRDRKGGAMSEWPEDLRVRQFPRVEVV